MNGESGANNYSFTKFIRKLSEVFLEKCQYLFGKCKRKLGN